MGRDRTKGEYKEALKQANERAARDAADKERLRRRVDELEQTVASLINRLKIYENPFSPPSARSVEQKARKKKDRDDRRKAEENGTAPPRGKPGGRPGHKGKSRSHEPTSTVDHKFPGGMPRCACGHGCMMPFGHNVRDIVDVKIVVVETRHRIQIAKCGGCGATAEADHDLPAHGSYGKRLQGIIASLRGAGVPHGKISWVLKDALDVKVAKSTIVNTLSSISDALGRTSSEILEDVRSSPAVGIDETGFSLDGRQGWAHVIQSKRGVVMVFNKSRGAYVMDAYMDGYDGCVVTDRYGVYHRFDPGGKHQACWAHELLNAKYYAQQPHAHKLTQDLHSHLRWMYGEVLRMRETLQPSASRRKTMEETLVADLARCRGSGDAALEALAGRLERAAPLLFTCLEYAEVDTTNNASERALRHVVVMRKISGQIKGGTRAMRRMSDFITCLLTWKLRGLSVAGQVARLI